MNTLLIFAQSVAAVAPPSPAAATVSARDHIPACTAAATEEGDIIVCGRKDRDAQYRLPPLTHRYDPVGGPGIGFKVGAGRGNVYSTSEKTIDGKPDKRIMMTVKLPF